MSAKITGILLLAGTGDRFGSPLPKQFHRLAGKKIYQHTLQQFLASGLFTNIILACPSDWLEQVQVETSHLPQVQLLKGGSTRQESSFLALQACDPDTAIVVIHDAVRPFVSLEILRENVHKAKEYGAVNTCIPSADTLVHAPIPTTISTIPQRNEYLRGQTPQSFRYPVILHAHQAALAQGIHNRSDDCTLVLQTGHPVHIVPGSEHNIKITTELDLYLAEHIYRLTTHSIPPSSNPLAGKRYIVTGGTGGIGSAICNQLQEEGAIPIPISRSAPLYAADLTSYPAAQLIFQQIYNDFGPVDGLINSIGQLKLNPLSDLSPTDIDNQLAANLKALIFCCKCVHLKEGAHIVNIASSSYARGRSDFTVYSSAKAAVVNFTQGLAEERPNTYINAVVPQRTHTPMRTQNYLNEDIASLLTPQEVASEILALLRHQGLTGSIIEIRKK